MFIAYRIGISSDNDQCQISNGIWKIEATGRRRTRSLPLPVPYRPCLEAIGRRLTKSEKRRLGRNLPVDVDPQPCSQLIEFFDPTHQPPQSYLLRQRLQTVDGVNVDNGIGASPRGEHEQVAQQRRDQGKFFFEILALLFAEVFSRFEQTM